MDWLKLLLCVPIGYLLGCISTGILLTRRQGVDIRAVGSKNTGASNVLRVLGLKLGLITFLGDFLKTVAAIALGLWLAGREGGMLAALFAVVGHNWPVFYQFKGGKGVACSCAVLLVLFPWQGAVAIAACVGVIALTRYISLGSLTMLTVYSVLIVLTVNVWPVGAWSALLLALSVLRHKANIQRLLSGTENKISIKK